MRNFSAQARAVVAMFILDNYNGLGIMEYRKNVESKDIFVVSMTTVGNNTKVTCSTLLPDFLTYDVTFMVDARKIHVEVYQRIVQEFDDDPFSQDGQTPKIAKGD